MLDLDNITDLFDSRSTFVSYALPMNIKCTLLPLGECIYLCPMD